MTDSVERLIQKYEQQKQKGILTCAGRQYLRGLKDAHALMTKGRL